MRDSSKKQLKTWTAIGSLTLGEYSVSLPVSAFALTPPLDEGSVANLTALAGSYWWSALQCSQCLWTADTEILMIWICSGRFKKGGGEEEDDIGRWGTVWKISRQIKLLKYAAMLSLKDALKWRGRCFIWRAEFLKGHLPEAAAGGKRKLSWAPREWRACKAGGVCTRQTGSGFLVWQVPEPTLHKTVTRTLFLGSTERRREPAKAWCSGEGSCKSHLPCLSSLKTFSMNYGFCSAAHPVTTVHFEKIRCLLGEILFPICFSELL